MIDKTAYDADNNNAGLAIDTLDTHTGNKSNGKGTARLALFVSLVAVFFTAVGIGAGYRHWQRMNDKVRVNTSDMKTLNEQVKQVPNNDAIGSLRKEVEEKLAQTQVSHNEAMQEMARMQNQTRQFADTVAAQVEQVTFLQARMQQNATPSTAKEWQVEEVAFLLQMANRELHLANNVQTAKASMKEADSVLAAMGAVDYLPVRQQIARDISALDAVQTPDIAGTAQRLNALLLALKPLPAVDTAKGGETVPLAKEAAEGGNSLWAEYKREALDALDKAVVVRRFDQPLQAALDADSRQNLFNLLHLRLETLRLFLLQRDNMGFRAQLGVVRDTLKSYYPEAQAKPLLEELQPLDKLDLQPVLPDISASLKQLDSARQAEMAKQPVATTPAAPVEGKAVTEPESVKPEVSTKPETPKTNPKTDKASAKGGKTE